MQFLYEPKAGSSELTLDGENYRYLFRVRRYKRGESVTLHNLRDDIRYLYRIESVGKREALLKLSASHRETRERKRFHLIWCVIDQKIVEKTLPMLNQLGLSKITFVYCARSQKNFRPDMQRLEKILVNSCQQCGRTDLMEIETLPDLHTMLQKYSDFSVLDFGGAKGWDGTASVLVGCEGGFTEEERQMLQNHHKIGLDTDLILKSETAAVAIASKLLI